LRRQLAERGRINGLLPPGSLDSGTRMVLVNAIHLKLPWTSVFHEASTGPGTFTKAGGATVSARYMNKTATLPYVDDGAAQIVGLPLAGGALSVVLALPHGDLATYEAGLAAGSAALSQPSNQATVDLSVPKISFTSPTFSLTTSLAAMGMTQPFDEQTADFRGLCANPPDGQRLHVHDVLQKTMVAMEETGVEAAAATAVVSSTGSSSGNPTPVMMAVDRPYLLAIVDVPTGAILFLGHIGDPTDAGSP
jgi:serpin B